MDLWRTVRKQLSLQKRVVAHILDPITGYSNRELRMWTDIDPDTVRRLGYDGEIFVIVDYQGGVPTATVCERELWLRTRDQRDAGADDIDPSVWPKREELRIG